MEILAYLVISDVGEPHLLLELDGCRWTEFDYGSRLVIHVRCPNIIGICPAELIYVHRVRKKYFVSKDR